MSANITRRTFMLGATTAAAAMRVMGANDRLRLGVIGCGRRASQDMRAADAVGNCHWVAVSDIWDVARDRGEAYAGTKVAKYADYRQLLDRQDIDGVLVATFDHVHAQITIDACHAGKDVYVEKPITSIPEQGPQLVKAVRETNRIVQAGTQQRSTPHFIEAKQKFFDSGLIGKVNMVRTIWNGTVGYVLPPPEGSEQKPPGLDWDACLAWLPKIPWDPKRYFNRFAYWDFSTGGQTGGMFIHQIDVVHWFMNLQHPSAAVAAGGIYQFPDGRDTPDNINVVLEYPEKVNVTYEGTLTDWIPDPGDICFMGTGGRLNIFRYGYKFIPARGNAQHPHQTLTVNFTKPTAPAGEYTGGRSGRVEYSNLTGPTIREFAGEITSGPTGDNHMGNWLECMRTRKQPNADVVAGVQSAAAVQLANIAYKQGGTAKWQKEWEV